MNILYITVCYVNMAVAVHNQHPCQSRKRGLALNATNTADIVVFNLNGSDCLLFVLVN